MVNPLHISSPSNQRIKDLVKLRDNRHLREATATFVVEGRRECKRALASGFKLKEVYVCDVATLDGEDIIKLPHLQIVTVTPAVMAKLAMRDHQEMIIGVFVLNFDSGMRNYPERAAVLVLDGMEKPGNLGAIYRSADAAGVAGILIAGTKVDRFNPNAIRASLGTIFAVQTMAGSDEDLLAHLRQHNFKIVVATPDAHEVMSSITYPQRCAFVVGSEAFGVSEFWRKHANLTLRITMSGIADSLNASVTAALLAFSFRDHTLS